MCCGNEHDNDPKYKRARCCACFNLAGEITFLMTLCWAMFAATLAMIYMCSIHGAATAGSSSSSSYELVGTGQSCTSSSECPGSEKCYTTCNYNNCPNPTQARSYAAESNQYKYHDSSDNRLCEDYECNLSEANYESCGYCPRAIGVGGTCYREDSRRLSSFERHAIALYDTTLESLDKHARLLSDSMNKHARLLSDSQSEAEKDYEKVKEYAKAGCDASVGFTLACYGGFFFGLMSLIFSSVNVCNCCQDCCGGFQGQFRCFGIYSIVSSVWQLICMGLLGVLLSSVAGMNNMLLKWCKDSSSSSTAESDCENSDTFQLVRGIELSLAICMVLATFVFLGRLFTAIFSLIAASEEHSSQKKGRAVEVPMQGVVLQQVPVVVQKHPQQNYV